MFVVTLFMTSGAVLQGNKTFICAILNLLSWCVCVFPYYMSTFQAVSRYAFYIDWFHTHWWVFMVLDSWKWHRQKKIATKKIPILYHPKDFFYYFPFLYTYNLHSCYSIYFIRYTLVCLHFWVVFTFKSSLNFQEYFAQLFKEKWQKCQN